MKKPWRKARKVPRAKLPRRLRERRHKEPGRQEALCSFYGILPRGIPEKHSTHDFVDDSKPKIRFKKRQQHPRYYKYNDTPTKWQRQMKVE